MFLGTFVAVAYFFASDADQRWVLAPLFSSIFIGLFFWLTLISRRADISIDDPGVLTCFAIVCYTIIPLLQFLLSGMEHTPESAVQLYGLAPTPKDFGVFAWWYVAYLFAFATSYLVTNSKDSQSWNRSRRPYRSTAISFLGVFFMLSGFLFLVEKIYGINMYGIYDKSKMDSSFEAFIGMPLIFKQLYGLIGHIGILFIVKLGLLLILILNWEKKWYRYTFFIYFFWLILSNILWMGARTELILLILAAAGMYHRFVQSLKLKRILAGGLILFIGFMIIGLMRGGASLGENAENLKSNIGSFEDGIHQASEFQVLFGGNYDLLWMKKVGQLQDVPIQFTCYDLIMLVPQQLLPFEKIDVQKWYLNQSTHPGYFMFNPISQAIIGFGWTELLLRGCLLGFLLAKLRSWYVSHSSSFWATLFYFYITIIAYYTIRGTAFYVLLASILYRFIPLYILVWVMTGCGRRTSSKKSADLPSFGN
jgi:hypothetical protein